jgi:hypothetical protein
MSTFRDLPSDATNAEALEWVRGMRRLVDRWELLPGGNSISPQLKSQAHRELDDVENTIRRNMN